MRCAVPYFFKLISTFFIIDFLNLWAWLKLEKGRCDEVGLISKQNGYIWLVFLWSKINLPICFLFIQGFSCNKFDLVSSFNKNYISNLRLLESFMDLHEM